VSIERWDITSWKRPKTAKRFDVAAQVLIDAVTGEVVLEKFGVTYGIKVRIFYTLLPSVIHTSIRRQDADIVGA